MSTASRGLVAAQGCFGFPVCFCRPVFVFSAAEGPFLKVVVHALRRQVKHDSTPCRLWAGTELERHPSAGHMSWPWPAACFICPVCLPALANIFYACFAFITEFACIWNWKRMVGGLTAGCGRQVAGDGNSAAHVYPDQSLYPSNSVPLLVERINNALQRADQVRVCTDFKACMCLKQPNGHLLCANGVVRQLALVA